MKDESMNAHTRSAVQEPLIGLATLMKLAFTGVDLAPIGARLLARAENNPDDANALMDMAIILQFKGNPDVALAMQAEALNMQRLYCLPAVDKPTLKLLAIVGPGDLMANTPLEFLVEGSDITLEMLYMETGMPFPEPMPEHDLLFVAIGESDQNHALLQHVECLVRDWPRPVLNAPGRIADLSRDGVCTSLAGLRGVVAPVTARVYRQTLERIARSEESIANILSDGDFPIIIRPIDSHAGRGLAKLEQAADVEAYLLSAQEHEFFIARFVDYRGADGQFRKYRIVLIDGRPFVCHMAVSARWMVHYLNADMLESAGNRAEEERFMASFDEDFARRHAGAFRAITERIGLDYMGIDCGETPDGQLLIFEVDSNMIVHAMDSVEVFPYKQPQMRKVFSAFRQMLINKA